MASNRVFFYESKTAPPMPPTTFTLSTCPSRAGSLATSLIRSQKHPRFTSATTFRPILLFPCPGLKRTHSQANSTAGAIRNTRDLDAHQNTMGKEGKGNFQLKTPKGTRDCMFQLCSAAGVMLTGL